MFSKESKFTRYFQAGDVVLLLEWQGNGTEMYYCD